METRHILMTFEELIQILLKTNRNALITRFLKIQNPPSAITAGKPFSVLEEWVEKYQQTWWEVIWTIPASADSPWRIQQCLYVADSLSDAVRLRPYLDISFRSFTQEQLETAFEENGDSPFDNDWNEEAEVEQYL